MAAGFSEATFEAIEHIENPFAGDKANTVGETIDSLFPEKSEMQESWNRFAHNTNPNENRQLYRFTTERLLDQDLVERYGLEAPDGMAQIVDGSPRYTSYRNAAAETYDFFDRLLEQGTASPENIQGLVDSFGTGDFPNNSIELESMLGISMEQYPDLSMEVYPSMLRVDTTLKMAAGYGEGSATGTSEAISSTAGTEETPGTTTEQDTEAIEGEVVFHNEKWLTEDIDERTKQWLETEKETNVTQDAQIINEAQEYGDHTGNETIAGEFTEQEQQNAQEYAQAFTQQAKEAAKTTPGAAEVLEEVFDGEGDAAEEAREATKLLMRIAIKASVSLAVSLAKNIAKNSESKEVRIALGVFADGMSKAGSFADSLIAGKSNANLEKDLIAFITDEHN